MLEQNSIGYTFPDDIQNCLVDSQTQPSNGNGTSAAQRTKSGEDDWQIIIPMPSGIETSENGTRLTGDDDDADSKDEFIHLNAEVGAGSTMMALATTQAPGGIFPAARARLASLRDLGAKKIGALKLKLIENKIKSNERGKKMEFLPLGIASIFAICRSKSTAHDTVGMHAYTELLTRNSDHSSRPIFHCAIFEGFALIERITSLFGHIIGEKSDELSIPCIENRVIHSTHSQVHSMDISLIPLHIYKIPKDCTDVLITPYIMFTKQTIAQSKSDGDADPKTEPENCETIDAKDENIRLNAVGVIGCNTTTLRIGEDSVSKRRRFTLNFVIAQQQNTFLFFFFRNSMSHRC